MASDAYRPGDRVPLLLAVSSLAAILAPLNSTMVAVALPDIRNEFSLSHGTAAWLISGYLIAMAVAQPIGGRLGDQIGRERVLRAGLLAFLVLAVLIAFAPSFAVLAALRIAQAVAGAVLIPNGMAMLRAHAPDGQLGRLNGINGAVLSFAAAAGPLLGAVVLAIASWRWIFPISIPFIAVALLLLPMLPSESDERIPRTPFDWLGTALFVALLTVVTLQLGALRGSLSVLQIAALCLLTALIAVAFIWRQRGTASPAAEWRLFRVPSFAAATAYTLLTNLTMYTTLLMIPFFVREVQEKSTALSGVLLGAMSVLVAITAPFGGRLSDQWGRRPAAQLGAVLMLVATTALFVGLTEEVSAAYLAGCLAVLGLGLGLGVGAANTAAIESAPRRLAGSASGTSSMMRYGGSIIGAGLLGGVLSSDSNDLATFRVIALVVLITTFLAMAAAMFIHRFADTDYAEVSASPAIEPI